MGKKGEQEIPGLTDVDCPRRLAPKRASKIRKLFNLTKADDVRKYVVRRTLAAKERKKHLHSLKKIRGEKSKAEAAEYQKLVAQRAKERAEKRREQSSKRVEKAPAAAAVKPAAKAAPAKAKAAAPAKAAKGKK